MDGRRVGGEMGRGCILGTPFAGASTPFLATKETGRSSSRIWDEDYGGQDASNCQESP